MHNKINYSVFLTNYRKDRSYLTTLPLAGSVVFTSLHITEEFDDDYVNDITEMIKYLKERGCEIMADVSKRTLSMFQVSSIPELAKSLNLDYIRLDFGFTNEEILELSSKMNIVVNASTIPESLLAELPKQHSLFAMHNYYPRSETGLSAEQVQDIQERCHTYNIPTIAFIPGFLKRGPIFDGLPTLEQQRFTSAYVNFVQITERNLADIIFVGDIGLDSIQEALINEYLEHGHILLPATLDQQFSNHYQKIYSNRVDSPPWLIRVHESRMFATAGEVIKAQNTVARKYGNITIDNLNYKRYSGEIQIMRNNFPEDSRVNVIGHISPEYTPLLTLIKPNQTFMFVYENE